MPKATFANIGEIKARIGQEIAVGEWFEVTQQRITRFAVATDDHQWIHTDPARAMKESPFGGAVAHGYLTLSLVPALFNDAIEIGGLHLGINYGLNRVRFPAPVPVGSRLRGTFEVVHVEEIQGGGQTTMQAVIEREGSEKPVCVAEVVFRHYT